MACCCKKIEGSFENNGRLIFVRDKTDLCEHGIGWILRVAAVEDDNNLRV